METMLTFEHKFNLPMNFGKGQETMRQFALLKEVWKKQQNRNESYTNNKSQAHE